MKKILLCFSLILTVGDVFSQTTDFILPDSKLTFSVSPAINNINSDVTPYLYRATAELAYEKMLKRNLSVVTGIRYFMITNPLYGYSPPQINLTPPPPPESQYFHYLSASIGVRLYDLQWEPPIFYECGFATASNLAFDTKNQETRLGYFNAYLGVGIIFQYTKKLYGNIEPILYYPIASYDGGHFFGSVGLNIGLGMKI